MTRQFDAIIIGTGQAGPFLAHRLAAAGWKVAFVERKLFGGTCVNTGCIPTKTLVASAYAAHMTRRAADFGVSIQGSIATDMKAVKARKDAISAKSRTGVEGWLRNMQNCTVYDGHARFESSHRVRVGVEVLEADRIFINVGGRASTGGIEGAGDVKYLTNSSLLDIDFMPEHLVIVGGSYVGLEFAQIYRRFGSEVTVIEKGPRLIGREDVDVSEAVKDILEGEGINVRVGAECIRLKGGDGKVTVQVNCKDG